MSALLKLLIWMLIKEGVIAQTRQKCVFRSVNGACVPFKECSFSSRFNRFAHEEDIAELNDRSFTCKNYNKKLICCEKASILTTTQTTTTRKTTKNIITVLTSKSQTATESSKSQSRVDDKSPSQIQINPVTHVNYKYFKDIKCGSATSERIANGNDSAPFEFPWAARVGYQRSGELLYLCGATLISEFYSLTAAHCLVGLSGHTQPATVRLGEYDVSKEIKACDEDQEDDDEICSDPIQDINIKSFLAHPQYDRITITNDIGLIQLVKAANVKQNNIKPICLPFSPELQRLPVDFLVIGWGLTEEGRSANILQKAKIPLYAQDKCVAKFLDLKRPTTIHLTDGQFCAGGEGSIDACRGDSGSSVQFVGEVNGRLKMVQYGVVSYGVKQCGELKGFPGIYTKVSKYLNWILDNMK